MPAELPHRRKHGSEGLNQHAPCSLGMLTSAMTRTSIVQDYRHPQPGETATLTLNQKVQQSILENGIRKPKGYTVSYHANPEVEKMHFGSKHPMKPWRLTLTNKIVFAYGMHKAMDLYMSRAATNEEMLHFHKPEYVEFLQRFVDTFVLIIASVLSIVSRVLPTDLLVPDAAGYYPFGMGDDCPIFDGIYNYCSLCAGGSLDAARKLVNNQSDIAINWSGGLHHAKKDQASGFCYINDAVLAILELLRFHPRVLYIDIDVHHGDGVEQAFWSTDRVMTLSFHKYDKANFFPGTGGMDTTGPISHSNSGAHHSLNVPLNDGIQDHQYKQLYQDIVGACVAKYRPTAIVLQCGADSLGGDRLGCFNLGIQAHGSCVAFTKKFDVPLLVLGGGGYTPENVAKLWAHETSVCIGVEVPSNLPGHMPYLEHFDNKSLFPNLLTADGGYANKNSPQYLQSLTENIMEQLRYIEHSPSVQLQHIPPDLADLREELDREVMEQREREKMRRERIGRR